MKVKVIQEQNKDIFETRISDFIADNTVIKQEFSSNRQYFGDGSYVDNYCILFFYE